MRKLAAAMLLLATATAAEAQTTGAISGTVNIPIPVAVEAYIATADAADAARFVTSAITDANRQYTITGLAPGSYYVRTRIADPTNPFLDVWYNSAFVATPGVRPHGIVVSAGTATSAIDLTPTNFTGRITGTLTLATLPFKGMVELPLVEVYNESGVLVRTAQLVPTPGASAGSSITTDPPAGGTWMWTVAGLPSGQYYVRTTSRASVGGHAHFREPTGGWWVEEVYNNIACVAEDCLPTRGTPITVTSGINGSGSANVPSVDLVLDYGAVISGATVDSADEFGPVDIYDARGVRLPRRSTLEPIPLVQFYFANGLPAGSYFVRRTRQTNSPSPSILYKDTPCEGCPVTMGTPVPVRLGETRSGIDFVAVATGGMRGTVRTAGAPTGQIDVRVYTHAGELTALARTASDGTYAIAGLAPGSYYVQTANALGFVDEIYDNLACPGCQPWRGTAVTVVDASDTTSIDFDLAAGVAVSGQVQAVPSSGAPWPVTGIGVLFYTPASALAGRAVSDTTGRYTITLAPGTYYAVSEATPGYLRRLYVDGQCPGGACALDTGTPIQVISSSVTNVDFPLTQCTPGSLAPTSLAAAAVGSAYRQTLLSTGSANPVYEVSAGRLPPGLTLSAQSGVLSGTPTVAGRYTFTIAAGMCAATRSYTLDVPGCLVNVPPSVVSRATGEPFLLNVNSNCSSWTATSNDSWISVQLVPPNHPQSLIIVAARYTGTTPRVGSITVGSRIVTVYQSGVSPQPPFGVLETPENGAVLSGSFGVTGWALDDLAVERVQIYRSPIASEGGNPVYLGDATFVDGARPDVEAAYPTMPRNRRAGFGYLLLSNMLPSGGNGVFTLFAYATDIDGVRALIGTRIVTVVNSTATSPFGAVDKPEQGATISGDAYVNFGWVLTPQPKALPFDGSTVDVLIDGVSVGNLTAYNLFRSDVTPLFPGLKNSGGPVGFRVIDTTALSEGIHTIAWRATDDGGSGAGIGSRYFTVSNSAWVPSAFTAAATLAPVLLVPERIEGVDAGRQAASLQTLTADAERTRTVSLSSQDVMSLHLGDADENCAPRYEGYLVAGDELRPLPVGSAVDQNGLFTWQPGPAFHGTYRLVFVRTACDGTRARIPVAVTIK